MARLVEATVLCAGCGKPFVTKAPNQIRCTPRCGWQTPTHRLSRLRHDIEFIGVDGEGVTDPVTGLHRYVLLSVGDQSLTADKGKSLQLLDILPFVWGEYLQHRDAVFIGYYLSYDFSQWFKSLPEERARMLFTERGRASRQPKSPYIFAPFPVHYQGWDFDFLGLRRLKLRPEGSKVPWLYICDGGPFWQTSFMAAIDPKSWDKSIVSAKDYRTISEGKRKRATAKFSKSMIKYNVTENRVLADVMHELQSGFSTQGWHLKRNQWFGPGQVAQIWLRAIGAPSNKQIQEHVPMTVLEAGRSAYYGGWFEIPRHGHIPGTSHEYDINSAYPYLISRLPCLLHGTWTQTGIGEWSLHHVTVTGSDPYLGPLPHRNSQGIICRPHTTTGWYWQHELLAAQRAGLIDTIETHESWTYTPCPCKPPLASIADLYRQRHLVGKDTAHGKALKLVYNSAYGKMAQSIGEPKFSNPIYASLITSGCRTMILDAIATHPQRSQAVLMVATDGVYFRTPHPRMDLGNGLGQWSSAEKSNLTLFMPGVYWDDNTRQNLETDYVKLKSRGINASELAKHVRHIDREFDSFYGRWPVVSIPIHFSVIGPLLALSRNDWVSCGAIRTYEHHQLVKELSAYPGNKREPVPYWDDGIITTRPYEDKGENHGYDKTFGMILEALLDNDALITDDGSVNAELYEALKGHE